MKKAFTITDRDAEVDRLSFWLSKTPEDRVEAVETMREHYYSMRGYGSPPRMRRIMIMRLVGKG